MSGVPEGWPNEMPLPHGRPGLQLHSMALKSAEKLAEGYLSGRYQTDGNQTQGTVDFPDTGRKRLLERSWGTGEVEWAAATEPKEGLFPDGAR